MMPTLKFRDGRQNVTVPHRRWKALGARWAGKFHRVPSLSYLYGSMGEGPDAKPAKMAKAKAAKRTKGRRRLTIRDRSQG